MCEVEDVVSKVMQRLEYGGYSWGDLESTSEYFKPIIYKFLDQLKEDGFEIVKIDQEKESN